MHMCTAHNTVHLLTCILKHTYACTHSNAWIANLTMGFPFLDVTYAWDSLIEVILTRQLCIVYSFIMSCVVHIAAVL